MFPLSETLKRLDGAAAEPTGPFGTHVELGNPARLSITVNGVPLSLPAQVQPYLVALTPESQATT